MKKRKLDKDNPIDRQQLLDYLANTLDATDRHRIERDAMTDPFLADALDGFSKFDAQELENDLAGLDESLRYRQSRRWLPMLWKVASVALLLLVPSFIVWMTLTTLNKQKNLALQSEPAKQTIADTLTFKQPETPPQQPTKVANKVAQNAKKTVAEPTKPNPTVVPDENKASESSYKETIAPIGHAKAEENTATVPEGNNQSEQNASLSPSKLDDALSGRMAGVEISNKREAKSKIARSILQAPQTITGRVVDDAGQPIPGANVTIKGSNTGTITNIDGEFTLALPDSSTTLEIAFIGFKPTEMLVAELQSDSLADITLKSDQLALNEVVVVGYGAQRKVSATGAVSTVNIEDEDPAAGYVAPTPTMGMSKYMAQLESWLVYPKSGSGNKETVVAKLTIGANGTVLHIDIVKSPNNDFSQEAIRIINKCGNWTPATQNGKPIESSKRLRIVFSPKL